MYQKLKNNVEEFSAGNISENRKEILRPLASYIQGKVNINETIRLNFICTHNSRRSHLSQIWAQAMAYHFDVKNVFCYSGGTEATAMFLKIAETCANQGFQIHKLDETKNAVYAVKYAANEAAVICFSKTFDHDFNPKSNFGAIMTCSNANEGCPVVFGAETRFSIKYDDPKAFDGTECQTQKYAERSLEIGQEMWWVFKNVKTFL